MVKTHAWLLAVPALLAGCTSLSTSSDVQTAELSDAVKGIPYDLPMLQYEVKTTRSLVQCFQPGKDGKPTKTHQLAFTIKAEATPRYAAGESYLIEYEKLAGFTKITGLTIENHEASGTLRSINAVAEDRSAQIIAAGVKTVIGIATLASGLPPVPAVAAAAAEEGAAAKQMLVCATTTQALLDKITAATVEVKNATTALEGLTEKVAVMTAQARAGALSDDDKKALLKLIQDQTAATVTVSAAQGRLDKAQNAVSSVIVRRWPERFEYTSTGEVEIDAADARKLAKLLRRTAKTTGADDTENDCDIASGSDSNILEQCVTKNTKVLLTLDRSVSRKGLRLATGNGRIKSATQKKSSAQDQTAANPPSDDIKGQPLAKGVFIRPPVRGRLLACKTAGGAICDASSRHILLRGDEVAVPQLGQLRFLPFKNEMFQNNALSILLRADGSVEKFEYKNLKAQGELLANTAADAVGQLQAFAEARRKQEAADDAAVATDLTASRAATLADIQFDIDRLTKQAALDKLNQPPTVSTTAPIEAETRQTEARVALLEAILAEKKALAALRDTP